MEMPWFFEILGIEPTKDKTAIKRAFSKLARKTNPEDDPDGYAKLHEAYRTALDYASGKVIPVVQFENSEKSPESQYDFSSVRPDNPASDLDAGMIMIEIEKLKNESKTNSFEDLFKRSDLELCETAVELFKLYSALAAKEEDLFVWESFFEEPLIKIIIKDMKFRAYILDSFPEGDINRLIIEHHVDKYEQEVYDSRMRRERRQIEIESESGSHETWAIIAMAFIFTSIAIILLLGSFTDIILYILTITLSLLDAGAYCITRYLDVSKNLKNKGKEKDLRYLCGGLTITVSLNVASWVILTIEPFRPSVASLIALVLCIACSIGIIFALTPYIRNYYRNRKASGNN